MNMYNSSKTRLQTASKPLLLMMVAGLMFGSAAVQADDIEIYLTPPPNPVPPNVLFILDESGSMNFDHPSRLSELKKALNSTGNPLGILQDPANDNINAGIMAYTLGRYNHNYTDSVRVISDFGLIKDNRANMISAVNGLQAVSGTPSVKALADAVGWFESGFTDTPNNIGGTNATYSSPLDVAEEGNWCRPNHIVFLTDGQPNSNNPTGGSWSRNWAISSYRNADNNDAVEACDPTSPSFDATTITNDPRSYWHMGGLCAGEIAEWANKTDLKASFQGTQNIVTHTIGFAVNDPDAVDFLKNIAEKGKGKYYPATNAAGLKAAFDQILSDATTSIPYTYSSPTIPYNPDNAALSGDFLYVPSFSPLANSNWKGNVKKYRVSIDVNGDVISKDRNGADVVDANFLFNTNTQDYWSSTPNTGATYYGGAVSNMSSTTTRRLYTWLTGSNRDLTATVDTVDPNGNPVTISPNRVHKNNILVTSGLVGAGSAAFRATVLDWANWIGDKPPATASTTANPTYSSNDNFPIVSTTAGTNPDGLREYMSAPMHTLPQIARYRPALSFTPDDGAGGGAVDAALNTITFGQAHIWNTGDIVVYSSEGGARLPIQGGGALSDGGEYYVVSVSSTAIQLAISAADATAGIVIDLADATGSTNAQSITTRVAIDIVLIATSEGVLHAFNGGSDTVTTPVGDGGGELWSFMPREFLDKISRLRDNPSATTPDYGLDGPMTIYDSGGKKYVAVTMRRGGRNMYVLDITDITKPKMAWEILGGSTTGFERLGQTWSEPQFLQMELNGAAARDVLVFGGGYDNTTQDHDTNGAIPASRVDDTQGNAIYVVDAATGVRLAYFTADTTTNTSASQNRLQVTGMENGIIGILPVDINNNGITDRLYATGVGGRVFRIDIPDSGFTTTTISGGVIADVNDGSANDVGFQRFFNKPEVAYYSRGGVTFQGILIGSGYRPSPLDNTTTDRFYMIKDTDVFTAPGSYTALGEGDLYDATNNDIQDGSAAQKVAAQAALDASSGWFIDLLDGTVKQKSFSTARIVNSVILFSTYQGQRGTSLDVCTATTTSGLSKLYAISLLDATAVANLDTSTGSGTVFNAADRSIDLNIPGLPPTPVIVYPPTGGSSGGGGSVSLSGRNATVIVGLESVFSFPDRFFPVNWEEIIKTIP